MALFGNENKKTIEELENYYSSSKTQRTGMAWAMAFLSLIITAVVLGGLFFGGRLLYRTFSNDSTDKIASTTNDTQTNTDGAGDVGLSLNGNTNEGVVSDEAANTDTPNTGSLTVTPNNNDIVSISGTENETTGEVAGSSTESTTTELPDTGAGSLLFAIPFASALVGYFASRKRQINSL